jgi:hypothetical protein
VRLRTTRGIGDPLLRQIEPSAERPGQGPLGVVAGHGDLAVPDLAQRPRVLPLHPGGGVPLLGEAGVVENQHSVALGLERQHLPNPLAIEILDVPRHVGEQVLKLLLRRAGHDLRERVAVLVRLVGEQAGHVALQHARARALHEMDGERGEELGKRGQRCGGRAR